MNEIVTTVMGNAVTDVTLKTLPSGNCVANFRIANNPKRFDKQSNTWQELDPNFLTINAWGLLAENIANSVFKGQPLIVNGKLKVKQWKDGEKSGVSTELDAISIGHDLTKGCAEFTKIKKAPDFFGNDNWSDAETNTEVSNKQ